MLINRLMHQCDRKFSNFCLEQSYAQMRYKNLESKYEEGKKFLWHTINASAVTQKECANQERNQKFELDGVALTCANKILFQG